MVQRLETDKLRDVAKFLHLPPILCLGMFWPTEHLGIPLLSERLSDPTMQGSFESIFPKDNPNNTRFSINFFASIRVGGITENLRHCLKTMPPLIMQQQNPESAESSGDTDEKQKKWRGID